MTVRRTPADAGAREIRRLLSTPDPAFERAARHLAAALPHGLAPSPARTPHLLVKHALLDSVQQVRRAYRSLHTRIARIETRHRATKIRALHALEELDSSFDLLLRSLREKGLVTGARLARQAHEHQAHAATELRKAFEELA
jgi:hypothetical protein